MPDDDEIKQGLTNRQFLLKYLPVLDMHSGRCIGAEAVSRWRSPTGTVQPLDLLTLVENTCRAGLLTYLVLEQIAKYFLDWLKINDAFVSFNTPPEIVGRGGLAYDRHVSPA